MLWHKFQGLMRGGLYRGDQACTWRQWPCLGVRVGCVSWKLLWWIQCSRDTSPSHEAALMKHSHKWHNYATYVYKSYTFSLDLNSTPSIWYTTHANKKSWEEVPAGSFIWASSATPKPISLMHKPRVQDLVWCHLYFQVSMRDNKQSPVLAGPLVQSPHEF